MTQHNGHHDDGGSGGAARPENVLPGMRFDAPRRQEIADMIRVMEHNGAIGIPLPRSLMEALPGVIHGLMDHESPRIRRSGVALTIAAGKLNLDLANSAWKATRVESGEATEIIKSYSDLDIQAVIGRGDPPPPVDQIDHKAP